MSNAQKAPYAAMVERFNRLKKQYFTKPVRKFEDGEELPMAIDRAAIIQQFENMGVEVPVHPDDEMIPINKG